MGTEYRLRGAVSLAAVILMGSVMTGCSRDQQPPWPGQSSTTTTQPTTRTGTLTVSVTDFGGRPLADAAVHVVGYESVNGIWHVVYGIGEASTGANGVATLVALPERVQLVVEHELTETYRTSGIDVAQQGVTFIAVSLEPPRPPSPTVALLPVTIPAGSISEDRSELTLQVEIVASASAPFVRAQYGDTSATPALGIALALGPWQDAGPPEQCSIWLDGTRTVPSCGSAPSEDPYKLTALQYAYDPVGSVPALAAQGPADSVMLIMDQSGRVLDLDPLASRTLAARAFIARAVLSSEPRSLSVAGLAGDGGDPPVLGLLPEQPLWLPLGTETPFWTDQLVLEGAVDMLEPLVGGSAPVLEALADGLAVTASQAPPGNRALVALLGGGDDSGILESERRTALASLRRQRDDAGIQTVLIAAAPFSELEERLALAKLAAALRAPAVSLGVMRTWDSGSYAALDLAADLIDGAPLPSLSAEFRVKADQPDAFPPGATMYGQVSLDSDYCPWDCWVFSMEFAAEIP